MAATVRGRQVDFLEEAATHTLATPSATQGGDSILVWVSSDEVSAVDGAIPEIDAASVSDGWITNSAWTMEQGDTTNVRGSLFYLATAVGGGADELVIDFPVGVSEPVAYIAIALAGADTPVVSTLTSESGSDTVEHTPAAITDLDSGDYLSILFIAIDANGTSHDVTAPTGWSDVQEAEPDSPGSSLVMAASMERTLPGVTSITPGAIEWTNGDQSIAAHVAVPAVSGEVHHFYLANLGAELVPGTASGFLDDSTEKANARQLTTSPTGAADDVTVTETSSDTAYFMLLGQWVSYPASGAGTLEAVPHEAAIAFEESSSAADMTAVMTVYVNIGDTTTTRGVAINRIYETAGELPTSPLALELSATETISGEGPVEFEAGDRIVVEVTARATTAATTPHSATLYFGGTSGTDLAASDTDTSRPAWLDLTVSPAGITFENTEENPAAGLATGTGVALDPTVETAVIGTSADAGLASGAGAALDPLVLTGGAIVVMVGDSTSLTAGDTAIVGRLQGLGHNIEIVDDSAEEFTGDYAGVVVTESVDNTAAGTKYATVEKPLIVLEPGIWDDHELTAATLLASTQTAWNVQDVDPLDGGLSGSVTVFSSAQDQRHANISTLGAGAQVVAQLAGDATRAVYVAYEAGSALRSGTAPARRVALGIVDAGAAALTADGGTLFDAAAAWAFVEVVDASPDAGLASGTGTANDPTVSNTVDASPAAGLAAGTGVAHDPADVDTDDGGAPLPADPGEALWIGPTSGKNHFNIGIGVETAQGGGGDDDHIDTDQDDIENGFSQDPEFKLTDDSTAVHFQIGVDAGRTSENTSYPRSELRELDESGENAAWNGGTGTHYMRGRSRITHTAAEKPWVVFFQIHDAESDLIRVQTESGGSGPTGLRIRARRTPPGGGSEVTTTLLSSYTLGDWIDWEIRVVDGDLTVTFDDVEVLNVAGGGDSEGCYFKAGCYAQSNTSTEGGDDTQFFSVEIAGGSFQAWHTGYATPTTPVYTGTPSDVVTHRLYLTNTAPSGVPTVTQGFWSDATPAITTPLLLGAEPSGTATTTSLAETSTTSPFYGLIRQFVSHPMSEGGTIVGVWQLVAGVQESDAAADMVFTVAVWVTQGEAAAARGTVLAQFASAEWLTTAEAFAIGEPSAITNEVEFQGGDRIVVEVGFRATNVLATSYTGTLNHGGTSSTDLASGDTDFTRSGWIDLQVSGAADLEFVDPGNNADAGLATGEGAALDPTLQTDNSPDAGLASGTGTAHDPTVTLEARPAAGLASGTGQAQTPGVSSDGNVSIAVAAATGVGAALGPSPSGAITPAAGLASGTGEAFGVLRGVNADAGLASGTGVAQEVDPQPNAQPAAGLATGTGQAHTPTVSDEDPIGTPILRNQFTDLDHHLVVEVAWGADLIGDGSEWEWTDITQDVRQQGAVAISMGRSDEASTTQPAECTLTLDNRQGLYSAGGQSPNWPYVRRNTPVRVRVDPGTDQETYVTRFFGYATSWTPVWDDSGKNAEVQLSAHGVLRRLGQRSAPALSSIRRALLDRTDVVAYWPCEEVKGAQKISSAFPGHPAMTVSGLLEQPFPKFAANDDFDCSLPLPEVALTTWQGAVPAYDAPSPALIEVRWLMATPDLLNGTEAIIMSALTTGSIVRWDVSYANFGSGSTRVYYVNSAGVRTQLFAVQQFPNNTVRQWSLTLRQNGSDIVATVTQLAAGWAVGGFFNGTVTGETVTACTAVTICPDRDIDDTAIGHIQVRNTVSTSYTELTELAANAGEIASDRIERLCTENNIPVTIIGTSAVKMGPQLVSDLLTLLRECEAADQGVLVDGLHAGLTYICRSEREGRDADLTLDAAQGHPAGGIEPVDDDQRNLNKATATRSRGLAATFEDVDGPMGTAAVGEYDDSVEVNTHEDLDIGDYASWLVNQGTVEGYRYPTLKVDLSAKPSLLDAWLTVLPSSRVDITNLSDVREQLPPGDVQLLVEGYSEEINQMTWTAELACSSYEPWRLGVLAASSSDTGEYVLRSVSDGSTLNASAAEGESTLSVSTPTGPRWTTALSEFPLDISVGGIRVTVTDIDGSGTVQTFTVDPNTVVKALPAGLRVDVWRPTVSAL